MNNTIKEALNIFNKNYNHQIILYGPPGTSKTYSSTIIAASFLAAEDKEYKDAKSFLKNNDHYQIVQFHPSYNYDDFVRGIKMSIQKGNPRYDVVNKIFGEFAEKAEKDNWMHQLAMKLQACKDSGNKLENIKSEYSCMEKVDPKNANKEKEMEDTINNLKENLVSLNADECKKLFDANGGKIKRDVDKISNKLESLKTYNEDNKKEINEQIAIIQGLLEDLMLELYDEVNKSLCGECEEENEQKDIIKLLNQKSRYVMVIDEINRAPLASVLGEMIYGLEYRDQPISTSYKLENGLEKIVIPDNLYIIGTMNTADRSIGTIDYAVRRRFAFIPVLPDWNVVENSWEETKSAWKDDNEYTKFMQKLKELWNILDPESRVEMVNTESSPNKENTQESSEDTAENGKKSTMDKNESLLKIKYNSSEIEVTDVQIGHTYFVCNPEKCKSLGDAKAYIRYRWEYEIIPILYEYANDEIILNDRGDLEKLKRKVTENNYW